MPKVTSKTALHHEWESGAFEFSEISSMLEVASLSSFRLPVVQLFKYFLFHRSHARAPLLNQEKAIFHHIFHPVLVNLFSESAVDTELAVGGLEDKSSKFSSESDQPTLRRLREPFDLHLKIASTPHRLHKCEPQIDERALRAASFQS